MMNITKRLYEIIFKYNLDDVYPQYRKRYYAEKILKKEADKWICRNEKVLIIYYDRLEQMLISKILGPNFSVDWVHLEKMEEREIEYTKYDKIVVSFFDREKLKKEFDYIWIYDIFLENKLQFQDDFFKTTQSSYGQWCQNDFLNYKWKNNNQSEFCTQKMILENAEGEEKRIVLKKCFFLALHMKNFKLARECAKQIQEATDNCQNVVAAMAEIEELLLDIKDCLKKRKQKDIIVYWLDSIQYGMEKDMPYLKKVLENSVNFTQAFTVTNNTNPTAQAIFRQKPPYCKNEIKPDKISKENSQLVAMLQENGYLCQVVSGYFFAQMESDLMSKSSNEIYDSCSMIFWDGIENILQSEKPVMLIAHSLTEGHSPFLSTKINMNDVEGYHERGLLARKELDEQLEFYDEFWHSAATRIYLSDHGLPDLRTQNHIILGVTNSNVTQRCIDGMYSIINFRKLLEKVVLGENDFESVCEPRYVEIERLDTYYNVVIKKAILEKSIKEDMLKLFGYKGIITREYMYLRFSTGKEWLVRREKNMQLPHIGYYQEDICDETLLPYFREIVGEYPKERLLEEKFKYSRYLHKIYENILNKQKKRIQMIENAFLPYSDRSVAIRMGGNHSAELYNRLSPACQRKIKCFVDNGEECVCKRFGLPVINVEQIKEEELEAVCLSSYASLNELRKEAEKYHDKIHIIDIYKILEEQGDTCRDVFYMFGKDDEYYDVDFPFDAVNI